MLGIRITSLLHPARNVLHSLVSRSLMSDKILKLNKQKRHNRIAYDQIRGHEVIFWRKFTETGNHKQHSLEDLKLAVCAAKDKSQLHLMVGLINRYTALKFNELRGPKQFHRIGTTLARQCYLLNSLDELEEIYDSDPIMIAFEAASSYIVYIDMLFENKKYEKVVSTFERFLEQQRIPLTGIGYVLCLYYAALYRIGSPEAFEKADNFWNKCRHEVSTPLRTYLIYAAMHLKRLKPQNALDILLQPGVAGGRNYLSGNMLIRAYIALGESEKAVKIWDEMRNGSILLGDTWKQIVDSGNGALFQTMTHHMKYSTLDAELYSTLQEDEIQIQKDERQMRPAQKRLLRPHLDYKKKNNSDILLKMDVEIDRAAKVLFELEKSNK